MKIWTFSAFYKAAIKGNIPRGQQQKAVNNLLLGNGTIIESGKSKDAVPEVSHAEASRYVKSGIAVSEFYRKNVCACSKEELIKRIKETGINDVALGAKQVVNEISSGTYQISEALTHEYSILFEEAKYEELLAKALLQAVKAPSEIIVLSEDNSTSIDFSFRTYYKNAEEAFGKMKTLLYTVEKRPVKDFYVCNSIRYGRAHFSVGPTIKNPTLDKLKEKAQFALITGAAGIGKSMLMRHFLLDTISQNKTADVLPILIMLREYQNESNTLFDMALKSAKAIDPQITDAVLKKALDAGKVKMLLDGVDEIREKELSGFISHFNTFASSYRNNQFVMSSRKYSSFVNLEKVVLFEILPLSKAQALRLIRKLEYLPDTPIIKADFLERLDKEYFETHYEFASNPLLLTLMLMTFRRFSRLPRRKHIFYGEAYATLLQGHDAQNKPGYVREFLSVDDPEDFTMVFREFCARSYRDSYYEFDIRDMKTYYSVLRSAETIKNHQEQASGHTHASLSEHRAVMSFQNFLVDADKNTSLLFEEGGTFQFRHRSFQEYFFADYYAQADDASLIRLGNYLESPYNKHFHHTFDKGEAFDMLYDMRPDKVERFVFLPFLKNIFDEGNRTKAYWRLLAFGYDSISYSVFDSSMTEKYKISVIRHRNPKMIFSSHDCSSRVLEWIISAKNIDIGFATEDAIDTFDSRLRYNECEQAFLYGHQENNDKNTSIIRFELCRHSRDTYPNTNTKTLIKDSDHKPIIFGNYYTVPFSMLLENPERFSALTKVVEAPTFPAREVFRCLEEYYTYLNRQYEHAGVLDTSF